MRLLFFCSLLLWQVMSASIANVTSENWKSDVMCEVVKRAEDEQLKKFWVGAGELKDNKLFLTLYFLEKSRRPIRWQYDCVNDTLEKVFDKYKAY